MPARARRTCVRAISPLRIQIALPDVARGDARSADRAPSRFICPVLRYSSSVTTYNQLFSVCNNQSTVYRSGLDEIELLEKVR